jgi:hypothetical protein
VILHDLQLSGTRRIMDVLLARQPCLRKHASETTGGGKLHLLGQPATAGVSEIGNAGRDEGNASQANRARLAAEMPIFQNSGTFLQICGGENLELRRTRAMRKFGSPLKAAAAPKDDLVLEIGCARWCTTEYEQSGGCAGIRF